MIVFIRLSEYAKQFRANMKLSGSRVWHVVCRTDKKLETAFCHLIRVVFLLSAPVLALLGALLGIGIGTFLAFFCLVKIAFLHKRNRRSNGGV